MKNFAYLIGLSLCFFSCDKNSSSEEQIVEDAQMLAVNNNEDVTIEGLTYVKDTDEELEGDFDEKKVEDCDAGKVNVCWDDEDGDGGQRYNIRWLNASGGRENPDSTVEVVYRDTKNTFRKLYIAVGNERWKSLFRDRKKHKIYFKYRFYDKEAKAWPSSYKTWYWGTKAWCVHRTQCRSHREWNFYN